MEKTSNVFGMDGDGVLIGRNKADTLIGADDDTYIVDEVGDDFDTYIAGEGDTIVDSDGQSAAPHCASVIF